MTKFRSRLHLLLFLMSIPGFLPAQSTLPIPQLKNTGNHFRLMVDDKPFLILGGELGNSTYTTEASMNQVWPKLKAMNLNTVLVPVYWELIEPQEGKFDFALYDTLLFKARNYHLKLVYLWFGSWKNSMSSHAPAWVKTNQKRFPRATASNGKSQEILTPFSDQNLMADKKAYEALLTHVKAMDTNERTVIMIQTENEIGMLPSARDHSPLADAAFSENIPEQLMTYLQKHIATLSPELKDRWQKAGLKQKGNWEEVFGKSVYTDEIFMAWHFSKYTNEIAAAGKEIYPIPAYVNAALNRKDSLPGSYPSAGPLPHLMDIWKAAGNAIDFLSPDFYNPNFKSWCERYDKPGNPLFIPEHQFDESVSAKALYAIGHHQSLGFSPFSIESEKSPENSSLGTTYALIRQLTPMLTIPDMFIDGVLLDKDEPVTKLETGDYELTIKHSYTLGYEADSKKETWPKAGAILIHTKPDEFFIAGSGVVITFKNKKNPSLITGILKVDEGKMDQGQWKVIRHLNGDQTHQGRHVRIFYQEPSILRFELYNYQ